MAHTSLIIGSNHAEHRDFYQRVVSTDIFDRILQAPAAQQSLQQLEEQPVDMIFYCAAHPDDGLGLMSQLQSRLAGQGVPLFLVSATDAEQQRIQGLEAGATDCLSFSTSPLELRVRFQRYLEQKRQMDELRKAKEHLERQATTDVLTGLYNRRFFNRALDTEVSRSNRNEETFALVLLDLDHFKSINDNYGHPAGDAVLRRVAALLRKSVRKSDTACRYGGEEFALVLPGASAANAQRIAERIRENIGRLRVPELPAGVKLAASFGITAATGPDIPEPAQLVEEADIALYRAKQGGRNRTEIFNPVPAPQPLRRSFRPQLVAAALASAG